MKIVLVCKVYPTSRAGGMGFVCQDRARELVRQGHQVHVFTTGREPHFGAELDDQGVVVRHLPCAASRYSDEFARLLGNHVGQYEPDILHLDSFDVNRPWWREFKGKTTLAITMHGFCWGAYFTKLNLWKREREPFPAVDPQGTSKEYHLLREFDRVLGISLHEHWLLRDLMGLLDARLVYNPVPTYFFDRKATEPPEKLRWLCAAVSGHAERGFAIAQRAAEEAGVELVVAGSRRRHEMPDVIDRCTGLVLPTAYAQGYDLSVVETLVRGRPVIACGTGSYLREAEVTPGAFYLVPQDGKRELAQAMSEQPTWFVKPDVEKHLPQEHCENWLGAILD